MNYKRGDAYKIREGISGNGCNLHNDCLSCPFDDCIAGISKLTSARKARKEKENAKSDNNRTLLQCK